MPVSKETRAKYVQFLRDQEKEFQFIKDELSKNFSFQSEPMVIAKSMIIVETDNLTIQMQKNIKYSDSEDNWLCVALLGHKQRTTIWSGTGNDFMKLFECALDNCNSFLNNVLLQVPIAIIKSSDEYVR